MDAIGQVIQQQSSCIRLSIFTIFLFLFYSSCISEKATVKKHVGDGQAAKDEENVERCNINWETLNDPKKLICLNSREAILASLPDEVRPYWMMMHESRSSQLASLENPRVIIMAPTGKFILAIGTTEDSQTTEVAIFDNEQTKWNFAGITFSGDSGPQVETESCSGCHTDSPRPIWSSYAVWPGTFGDEDNIKSAELNALNRFKSGNHAVFKHLSFQKSYPLEKVLRPNVEFGENGNNQIMNFFLAKNSGQALTKQIMNDSNLDDNDRLSIAYEMACSRNPNGITKILAKFGYQYEDYFSFHRVGDAPVRMWIGFNFVEFPAGIMLLTSLLDRNPDLTLAFPQLAETLEDERLKPLFNNKLAEHRGWGQYDFGFQESIGKVNGSEKLSCADIEREIQ